MILEDTYIDEGIGFGEDNQGLPDIKYTKNPDYYTDMYEAGQTKAPLIIGQEVEGTVRSVGGGNIKTGYVSVPSGYTDFAITGVGFTPVLIEIKVVQNNTICFGLATSTSNQTSVYYDGTGWASSSNRFFRFNASNVGLLVSIDSDGFTVKSDLACTMIYTCFG